MAMLQTAVKSCDSAHSATVPRCPRNRGISRPAPVISKKDAAPNSLLRGQKHALPFLSTQCQISHSMPHQPIRQTPFQAKLYPIMTSMTADRLPRRQILSSVPPSLLPQHPAPQLPSLKKNPNLYPSIPLRKGRHNYLRSYRKSNASSARASPQRQEQRCSCTSTRMT